MSFIHHVEEWSRNSGWLLANNMQDLAKALLNCKAFSSPEKLSADCMQLAKTGRNAS